jgi:hypothetical protein
LKLEFVVPCDWYSEVVVVEARRYSEIVMRHFNHDHFFYRSTLSTVASFDEDLDIMDVHEYSNYLPDELLLEVIGHLKRLASPERQTALARFAAVNR